MEEKKTFTESSKKSWFQRVEDGELIQVRKIRSDFGTRVARSIVCTSCGKKDIIDFAPQDFERVLCRKCAFEQLGVIDPDEANLKPPRELEPVVPELEGIEKLQRERVKKGKRLKSGAVKIKR